MRRLWAAADSRIAENVRLILERTGMNRKQLARRLGISERTLYQRLKKPSSFSVREIRVLKWLAILYGMDLEEFE